MPSYDPQRSRARLRAPEDEPAPVDALLGDPAPPDDATSLAAEPLVVDLDPVAAAGSPRRRRWPLLVVAAVLAALQFLVWRWWRHRRRVGLASAA